MPPLGPRRIQAAVQARWMEMLVGAQAHKAPAWVRSGCWWWGFNAGAALTRDCAPGGLVPTVRGWTLGAELGGWPCPGREGDLSRPLQLCRLCGSLAFLSPRRHLATCTRCSVCVCVRARVWCPGPDSPFNTDPCCVGLGHT